MKRKNTELGSVLIVEDEVILSELLRNALVDAGAGDIRVCASAAEALAQFEIFSPKTIILDVRLADRDDGWLMVELAREVFARMPLIIFATGSPELIPRRIADLGITAVKPYDTWELVEMIRRHHRPQKGAALRKLVKRQGGTKP